jgi:hypothetical protein
MGQDLTPADRRLASSGTAISVAFDTDLLPFELANATLRFDQDFGEVYRLRVTTPAGVETFSDTYSGDLAAAFGFIEALSYTSSSEFGRYIFELDGDGDIASFRWTLGDYNTERSWDEDGCTFTNFNISGSGTPCGPGGFARRIGPATATIAPASVPLPASGLLIIAGLLAFPVVQRMRPAAARQNRALR